MMVSNRLGGLGWNWNSCKTLKCPKCNWHYKTQETLEIHMKEKHPDSDSNCIYCITNQQHPRLARGETYTCGYKPYRCEVCNYSTTTKGNLSIHMQSEKHINNIQEIQNNGGQSFEGKGLLVQHCRSVKHLQLEQLHILQLRAEGGATPEIGDIFTVTSADQEDMDTGDSNKGGPYSRYRDTNAPQLNTQQRGFETLPLTTKLAVKSASFGQVT